jgi:hypothetical protein
MLTKFNPMDEKDEVVVVRKEEEIREAVIAEYGFDADVDAERIDKLVAKELDHDKKLSSAIGAKIKHRTEAEELKKKIPPEEPKPQVKEEKKGLAEKDVIYLAKASIHDDDVDEVVAYANKMEVSVKEAHKFFEPILAKREEQRKVAEATNTGPSRRSNTKASEDDLLARASKNELPDDPEDIERLMKAKLFRKNG